MPNPQLQIRLVDSRNLRSKKLFKRRTNLLRCLICLFLKELYVARRVSNNKLHDTFLKIYSCLFYLFILIIIISYLFYLFFHLTTAEKKKRIFEKFAFKMEKGYFVQ